MKTWIDSIGNVHGRVGAQHSNTPAIFIGSHYDTVVDAGMYDGVLGIVSAISAVKYLSKKFISEGRKIYNSTWNVPVEIVAFTDEEGVRFQVSYLCMDVFLAMVTCTNSIQERECILHRMIAHV